MMMIDFNLIAVTIQFSLFRKKSFFFQMSLLDAPREIHSKYGTFLHASSNIIFEIM